MPSSGEELTDRLKAEARRLNFDFVGVASAVAPPSYPRFLDWIDQGRAASMDYLERRKDARAHPSGVLEGVRSIVAAGFVYGDKTGPTDDPGRGKIARYARGKDYHHVLWKRLESLLEWLNREAAGSKGRVVADTAPLLERDVARSAGLGWFGKNTMLINKKLGSYTLLGFLLTDAELRADPPSESSHCGTCTRCLDACPTKAFDGPYVLDANRCISYWTIEHRGDLREDLRDRLDGWVFGCDVCQEVCPWNRKAPVVSEPDLFPRSEWTDPDLIAWLERDDASWTASLRGTALKRAKRAGLLRNAALVLGSRRLRDALPALRSRMETDSDESVRQACAWAIQRIEEGS